MTVTYFETSNHAQKLTDNATIFELRYWIVPKYIVNCRTLKNNWPFRSTLKNDMCSILTKKRESLVTIQIHNNLLGSRNQLGWIPAWLMLYEMIPKISIWRYNWRRAIGLEHVLRVVLHLHPNSTPRRASRASPVLKRTMCFPQLLGIKFIQLVIVFVNRELNRRSVW